MGYMVKFTVEDVINQIRSARADCNSPYTESFNAWGIKQDLYQIKWFLEDALRNCPKFSQEDQWVKDQEQKRLIKILKQDK